MASSLDHDLGYIQAALDELESYLLSNELFWSLKGFGTAGEPTYPQLTIGGLSLAFARAQTRASHLGAESQVIRFENKLEMLQSQWRLAWNEKATWEFHSRLRQWGTYLNEVKLDPSEYSSYYGYEVRWRVVLALLMPEAARVEPESLDLLTSLDDMLRSRFIPGDFIWDDDLSLGFLVDEYWYLWGNLR